jgi:hypothetical protein
MYINHASDKVVFLKALSHTRSDSPKVHLPHQFNVLYFTEESPSGDLQFLSRNHTFKKYYPHTKNNVSNLTLNIVLQVFSLTQTHARTNQHTHTLLVDVLIVHKDNEEAITIS